MSNRVIVKFGFMAAMFAFASCHSDVPELPSPEKVAEYKYCEYMSTEGIQCKSTYEISETDCERVGGKLFDYKENCEDTP